MTTQKEKLKADADELREDAEESKRDADRLEADLQDVEGPPREVVISIDFTLSTTDPNVTDAEILAAAEQQVSLPATIWVNKIPSGQIAVTFVRVGESPPPDPPIE